MGWTLCSACHGLSHCLNDPEEGSGGTWPWEGGVWGAWLSSFIFLWWTSHSTSLGEIGSVPCHGGIIAPPSFRINPSQGALGKLNPSTLLDTPHPVSPTLGHSGNEGAEFQQQDSSLAEMNSYPEMSNRECPPCIQTQTKWHQVQTKAWGEINQGQEIERKAGTRAAVT